MSAPDGSADSGSAAVATVVAAAAVAVAIEPRIAALPWHAVVVVAAAGATVAATAVAVPGQRPRSAEERRAEPDHLR